MRMEVQKHKYTQFTLVAVLLIHMRSEVTRNDRDILYVDSGKFYGQFFFFFSKKKTGLQNAQSSTEAEKWHFRFYYPFCN